MKVLILVDHAVGNSGPHRNVVSALNALSAHDDIDLRLLTGMIDENEPYASLCDDIRLGFEPHNPTKMLKNLCLLRQAVKDRDLIYVPTGLKSFLYAFGAKGKRKLLVGPNVTQLPLPGRKDHPGKIELKLMTDIWIEASNFRRDYVVKHTGIEAIICIHHAIDTVKFSPEKKDRQIWERFHVPENSLKVLYVGNDYFCKGVPELISAIELINQENRDILNQFAFIFAGNLSAKNKNRLQKINNAYMLGFLTGEDLPKVYASSHFSIVPSSYENFPFSVLEAMSSGLPVLASGVGGIPEQIVHGETGILMNISQAVVYLPDASQRLAEEIIKLADDPEKQRRLGKAARDRVLSNFSEDRLGQDLFDLFIQCLDNTGIGN